MILDSVFTIFSNAFILAVVQLPNQYVKLKLSLTCQISDELHLYFFEHCLFISDLLRLKCQKIVSHFQLVLFIIISLVFPIRRRL